MDILFAIIFLIFLNILPAIMIVAGIICFRSKTPVAGVPPNRLRILGIVLVVFGLIWLIRGFITGYGLQ